MLKTAYLLTKTCNWAKKDEMIRCPFYFKCTFLLTKKDSVLKFFEAKTFETHIGADIEKYQDEPSRSGDTTIC